MLYLQLFKTFFLIGLFSFGGGLASMELIRSRVVTQQHWLTNTEFTDIISISEMTPGPLGINIASFVGTRTAGIPGTVIATCAYVLPAVIIVMILAKLYYKYRNLSSVHGVLNGLHPAVAAMVLAAAVKLVSTAWWNGLEHFSLPDTDWIAVPITLVFLVLLRKKKIGPVQAILGPDFELLTPRDCGITEDIPEEQPTLEGNALQKARYVHERTGLDCFADDTGLEVEALGGAPGVRSARYAGDQHDFQQNR